MSRPYCQHVHIICRDMQQMIDFWSSGFEAVVEEYRDFSGAKGAILDIGMSAKLYLKEVPCEWDPDAPRRSGLEHIGMIVADLDAVMQKLSTMPKVSIMCEPFISEPVRCVYITGPEGVMLELMEYTEH